MAYPERKALRLPEYDYSAPGAYFVTVCTQDRRCLLSQISVGAIHESPAVSVHLTEIGLIAKGIVDSLCVRYPTLSVDNYVIMPNHIHLLLRIKENRAIRESPLPSPATRSLLSNAIGYLKMNSSKQAHARLPGLRLWQRGYYEHIIRSEKDYLEIWTYIGQNPAKWAEDRYFHEN